MGTNKEMFQQVEAEIETINGAGVQYKDMCFEGNTHGHAFGELLTYLKENEPDVYKACGGDEFALVALLESQNEHIDFEGFVTSTGRYVSRKEALEIASFAKQMQSKKKPEGELYSEDLK